nr:methyltransferase domain-containing protein [uncultured Desulfobulbus sp.]
MQMIDTYSRVTAEFSLSWSSKEATHVEKLWAHPVSFWRDILNPSLVNALKGKSVGDEAEITLPADLFTTPYQITKKIQVRPHQFRGTNAAGEPIAPIPGRYYPQGMLHGVGGIYLATLTPCRFLGAEGEKWIFDLNHPLAGYDLKLTMKILDVQEQQKERGGRCEDWLERITSDGPGMQTRFQGDTSGYFAPESFERSDQRVDELFYREPRLVQHLDSQARATISGEYSRLIPQGSTVLDCMGSWDSHLPETLELAGLTVLGMNEEELAHNTRATQRLVQDLNTLPQLPLDDASYDAVICTASVEYLTHPLRTLSELKRVLRPGGVIAFAFSNRWFPPKAIQAWTEMHEFERLGWVSELLHTTGGLSKLHTLSRRGWPRPADDPHQDLWNSDPVYMVWAYKA